MLEWRRAVEKYCGPERHLTTNVAARKSTTAVKTYVVKANCSRNEKEKDVDCYIHIVSGGIKARFIAYTLNNNESSSTKGLNIHSVINYVCNM